MLVIGSQKGDNPNIFYIRVIAPFLSKFKFSNYFFSTQRIELKLLTNVYINLCDGFTKRRIIQIFFISELLPLFCQKLKCSDKAPASDKRASGSTPF